MGSGLSGGTETCPWRACVPALWSPPFPWQYCEAFGPDLKHCTEEKWHVTRESHASGFPNKLFPRALRAQEAGVLTPNPRATLVLSPFSYLCSHCPFIHSQIFRVGPCQGRPGVGPAGWLSLRLPHHTLHVQTHTHPSTDSPSPVAASAVLCGHPANTWSAGGQPPCRYTCPHCPGRSCTPASSPRGWWATPGEGQAGKGTRRERENVRMRET